MIANRRRHPRIPFSSDIRLRVGKADLSPLHCTNISMGGMCVHIEEELEKGSTGKLWLSRSYPEGDISFEANVRVLWIRPMALESQKMCMGVEFVKMKRKHRDALLTLLRLQGTSHAEGAE